MRHIKSIVIFFVVLFASMSSFAQVIDPPNWEVTSNIENPKAGDTLVLTFRAEIPKDWYLYSSDFDPDLGPMITEIKFENSNDYQVIGDLIPINPKEKYDELWEGNYTYFTGKAEFQQRIKVLESDPDNKSFSYLSNLFRCFGTMYTL